MPAILVVVLALLAGDPPRLRYAFVGDFTDAQAARFESDLRDGHRLLRVALGSPTGAPRLVRVDPAEAEVLLFAANRPGYPTLAGEARPLLGPVFLYAPAMRRYGADSAPQIIFHELAHYYFDLPDEYAYDAHGRPVPERRICSMGNFLYWGHPPVLCDPCRARVSRRWSKK